MAPTIHLLTRGKIEFHKPIARNDHIQLESPSGARDIHNYNPEVPHLHISVNAIILRRESSGWRAQQSFQSFTSSNNNIKQI